MSQIESHSPGADGITLTMEGGVAQVILDLAQPKNAFRVSDVRRLSACLDEAVAAGARCLLLRGAGGMFSAGWDITSIDPGADDPVAMINEVVAPLCRQLRALPLPTLAVVSGAALGFGFGLALSCDIVLVDEKAVLGSPFRHIGMVPDTGTHHYLHSRLGYAVAAELIFTGRLLSGQEAAQRGLVNHALPGDRLHDEARRMAEQVASGPTAAFALSKQILQAHDAFDEVVRREGAALPACFATADLRAGLNAFVQRRPVVFQGR